MLINSSGLDDLEENMKLLPSEFFDPFLRFDDAYFAANYFAVSQGYALMKKRTKKSQKVYIERQYSDGTKERFINLEVLKVRNLESLMRISFRSCHHFKKNGWIFKVQNSEHNHLPTLPESHSRHRNLALNTALKEMTKMQLRTRTTSMQIIINARVLHDENNPLINLKDIYKLKQSWRQEFFGNLISTQALLHELFKSDQWFVKYSPTEGSLENMFVPENLLRRCWNSTEKLHHRRDKQNKSLFHVVVHNHRSHCFELYIL